MENRKTMLIVDDMEINRAILTQFFQDEFHIIEAENGREALDFIKSQPIDIILLDLMMPVMTGMEVLEWLLSNPRYGDIPVIVTTSADDVNSEVMAMERGAADYLQAIQSVHRQLPCTERTGTARKRNQQAEAGGPGQKNQRHAANSGH